MKGMLEPIIIVIGGIALVAVVLSLPTLLLWNWLLPDLFNFPPINFWQALGINLLCGVLFRTNSTNKKSE